MEQTLLLNGDFRALNIVSWQKAITLVFQEKVQVVAYHDAEKRAVSFTFRVPSIVRLLRYVKVRRRTDAVPFSRGNIFARDGYRCQYCGERRPTPELSFDHVVPSSQGGKKDWANIVTACVDCNRRKDDRTPAQAGMRLLRSPHEPKHLPTIRLTVGFRDAPASWREYIYWNAELEE